MLIYVYIHIFGSAVPVLGDCVIWDLLVCVFDKAESVFHNLQSTFTKSRLFFMG